MTWLCVFLGAAAPFLRPAVQLFLLSFSPWRSIISSLAASIIPYAHPREMEHITTLLRERRHDDLTARSSQHPIDPVDQTVDTTPMDAACYDCPYHARTLSNDDQRNDSARGGNAYIDHRLGIYPTFLLPLRKKKKKNTNDDDENLRSNSATKLRFTRRDARALKR